ncbi:MAG TPA: hypothetical protein VHF27_09475 [Acidimicrobiales bacterium]|nr:hypothetical protein [Acidimicrobiales bacterium]
MSSIRRAVLLLLLFLLLPAACSRGRSEGAATAPAPPLNEEEATVDRVLVGLDGVVGDLQRMLVKDRQLTPEVVDRLQAIYTGPELLNQIDAFRADLASGLARYEDVPGNRVTTVSRLITYFPMCVFAEVRRDYSPITQGPALKPASLYVILVPKHEDDDPRRLNPTPWAMLYDGVQEDGSPPDDVCR